MISILSKSRALLSNKYSQYKNMIVKIGYKCIVIDIQKSITWKYSRLRKNLHRNIDYSIIYSIKIIYNHENGISILTN